LTTCLAPIQATHSIEEAARPLWDAIVIGAGPAGAVTARELARRGATTLLVERQSFPRAKVCGGCLNGRALAGLTAMRLEHVLVEAHALPTGCFLMQANKRRVTLDLPAGVAVDRSAFDAALVRAATSAGAAFLPETTATVEGDDSPTTTCRTVQLSGRGQPNVTATARVVLVADGLGHASVRHLDVFRSRVHSTARVGLGLVVREPEEAYAAGTIHMAIARDGYVGLVRTANGNLNIAAALDLASLKSVEAPDQAINRILAETGLPTLSAVSEPAWRGTLPLTRTNRRLAAARIFLLGDAAGYVEPFTGEGMGWAIASAMSVVPYVLRSLHDWDHRASQTWEINQQRQMARGQLMCRILARLLRQPAAVGLTLGVLRTIPALANPIVRRIYSGPGHLQASLL